MSFPSELLFVTLVIISSYFLFQECIVTCRIIKPLQDTSPLPDVKPVSQCGFNLHFLNIRKKTVFYVQQEIYLFFCELCVPMLFTFLHGGRSYLFISEAVLNLSNLFYSFYLFQDFESQAFNKYKFNE